MLGVGKTHAKPSQARHEVLVVGPSAQFSPINHVIFLLGEQSTNIASGADISSKKFIFVTGHQNEGKIMGSAWQRKRGAVLIHELNASLTSFRVFVISFPR
ncbi:hypothetical protein NC652_005992 [Populus alba x Populus x berolinensis]|uniref:Uncharacterized protein n=1 Tax=Populus alba x Populus x berolinensis TaxID=444605 RepID=A0AAD6RD16_9ROSI|nr:hypothetical protein NC652_005992 [Populus alba x Populus x berolinensis]KAJ7006706.1 hypothetical protein NC653_005919 [Populus alba x Populus x berolinensis]